MAQDPVLPSFDDLLASAARLQALVPDTVLVGGAAVAYRLHHRLSVDHDHVMAELADTFDIVLEALEREGDWVTNRVVYGKLILGELGGIETGVRQLIRRHPLEIEEVTLDNGRRLLIPTADETLRIKAFLIVKRNQTRDYLDVAALADRSGIAHSAEVLSGLDEYYADQAPTEGRVALQLAAQLADPRPKDQATTRRLSDYKGLAARWHDWRQVETICHQLADAMLTGSQQGQH